MKPITLVGMAALAGATLLWLGLNQARLNARLAKLEVQNQQLADDLSNRPATQPDAVRDAQARLADTELALGLVEQRLSNLSSQLNTMQRKAQTVTRTAPAIGPSDIFTSIETPPAPRLPASSHSPTGQLLDRHWGPEQALGPPNTAEAGDIPTAWASRSANGGEEWLKLEYERPLDLSEVRVRESYHPGAIAKVAAVLPDGQEITIWEGIEPPAPQTPVDTSFPVSAPVRAGSVKVYLDTHRVSGWSEIDAVELVGRDGTRQWATAATASSTYAEQ